MYQSVNTSSGEIKAVASCLGAEASPPGPYLPKIDAT